MFRGLRRSCLWKLFENTYLYFVSLIMSSIKDFISGNDDKFQSENSEEHFNLFTIKSSEHFFMIYRTFKVVFVKKIGFLDVKS